MDSKWLTGDRDEGGRTNAVLTRNQRSSSELDELDTYKWTIVQHEHGSGTRDNGDSSTTCLKYGDSFRLQLRSIPGDAKPFLIGGGSGTSFSEVFTGNTQKDGYQEWFVRSQRGNGMRDFSQNGDPGYGHCVETNSVLYIQNMSGDSLWMAGTRKGGNEHVFTNNMYDNDDELNGEYAPTYHWILRKDSIGDGSRNDALLCPAIPEASIGRWESHGYTN
ncbi:MAG: hypothetical protein SGARI_006061, partial [Bacillariaceae sp.]